MENQRTVTKDILNSCPQPPTLCKGSKCPQCKFDTILLHPPAAQKLCRAEEHLYLLPVEISHPARLSHLLKTWFIILWSDLGTSKHSQSQDTYIYQCACVKEEACSSPLRRTSHAGRCLGRRQSHSSPGRSSHCPGNSSAGGCGLLAGVSSLPAEL